MTVTPLTPDLEVIDGGMSEALDKPRATALNDQIHAACSKIATDSFELVTLLEQAATGHIDAALGYPSWTAWFAENVTIDISNRDERKMMAAIDVRRRHEPARHRVRAWCRPEDREQ